jgi:membrane-associated phospholipid phosphatase
MPRRAVLALLGAVAGVALLIAVWFVAFHVGGARRLDASILRGFGGLRRPRVDSLASHIASLCNPKPFVYLAAAPVLLALARRRPRVAVAIAAVLSGANVTTQLLKPLLASPRPDPFDGHLAVLAASWPSGHATAAMSLTLTTVLAMPPRLRPWAAAAGAAFTVAVVYSFLTLGWHYPSDVLGGFLVSCTWTLLAVGCVWLSRSTPRIAAQPATRRRPSLAEALGPPALALLGAAVLVGLVVIARPHAVVAYARAHTAFVVGAASIAAAALAIATGVMLAVRR